MKKFVLLLGLFTVFGISLQAQVKIGGAAAIPHPSAVLELDGGSTRGLLLPRMRKLDMLAIVNPAEGLTLYVTDEQATYLRRLNNWVKISGSDDAFTLPYTGIFSLAGAPVLSLSNLGNAGTGIHGGSNVGAGTGVHGFSTAAGSSGLKGTSNFGRGGYFSSKFSHALVTDTGRIGFGTLSPTAFVEIDASRSDASSTLIINDDDDPLIQFKKADINKSYIKQQGNDLILRPNGQNFTGKVILQAYNQGGWMFVDANGNASFGQDPATFSGTPNNARVHIKSSNDYPLTLDAPVGAGGPALRFIDKAGNSINNLARIQASATSLYTSHKLGKYEWAAGGIGNAMVLQESGDDFISFNKLGVMGYIGAGTLNPGYPLHVIDHFGISASMMLTAPTPTIHFRAGNSPAQGFITQINDDLKMGTFATNDAGRYIIRTNGTDRMFVNPDGRIIVGSSTGTSPAGSQMFKVRGGIQATDFTVTPLASWPDYVFAEDYKLKSLEETEAFIKANKHLPNIPAAAVIEKDGFALGDMQKRMMEKIEELTLYLIEANKEIQILKKQMAERK